MGQSSGSSSTTQRTEPPTYQLPYLQQGIGYSQGLFNEGGPQQYQGNTIVPFAPQTEAALSGIEQRATNGSPVVQAAQNFVTQGLNGQPASQFGSGSNPYATAVNAGGQSPYGGAAFNDPTSNPYSNPVATNSAANPYANSANPFGGASNPYLDATFEQAAQKSRGILDSEFARSGRNISASAPARADMLSDLASKIYAPAYENERNRQLQYQGQLTGIGAQGYENARAQGLQAALQGQQIGAQGYESGQGRNLQAALQGQQLGASGFESAQQRQLQAGLAGQQIGAQGYENAQTRSLQDLLSQRSNQLGLLGYASPLAEQDYRDLSALRGVGSEVEGQAGRIIDDNVSRWDFEQNRPEQTLDQYLARISGNMGSTTTINTPTTRNRTAGALGGAMAGAPLGPWGMLGGAVLGGLF